MSQAMVNPVGSGRHWRRLAWIAALVVVPIVGVVAAVVTGNVDSTRELAIALSKPLLDALVPQEHGGAGEPPAEEPLAAQPYDPSLPWDGVLHVTPSQQKAIGTRIVPVKPQSEPLDLELQGKTDYNPDTLVKVRPRFDALVLTVHATVGQKVKKGDPLVELYSVRLAETKLQYESKQSQAEHDHQIAEHQRDLVAKGVIPDASRVLLDAVNAERQSQLEYKLARDELEVFGVAPEEIARLHQETGTDKAKMMLRAQTDGTIVSRDVAVGNIYDEKDTLLTIASIEQLWVWGNVYERDLADVRAGLPWEVHFPFTREMVAGTVEYVSSQVDAKTHAVRIRGSIPNADGRFKSDQFVRVIVKCPPDPGSTVIPRIAVVTDADENFVFVQRPGESDAFERRAVSISHEFSDRVIVSKGLEPGELVATNGSLVMTQLYEDRKAVETGSGS
ncbi:MAG: efflux RND transporter periplasmic adaptor subunit [Planctomycetota bacterium]